MNVQTVRGRQVTVNGRDYRFPGTPTVAVCIDGSEPGYIEAAIAAGLAPNLDRLMRDRRQPARAIGDPQLHQSQQHLHHHRPPAFGARYQRQLLLRPRRRPGSHDERCALPARAHHHGGVPRCRRAASPWSPPRTSCAPCSATGSTCARGRAIAFSSEKADRATLAENGITDVLDFVGMTAARCLFRRPVGVRLRRWRKAAAQLQAGPDVSLHHRLRAAQGRPGLAHGQRLLRHDRPLRRRARQSRRGAGAHRRPRHERQAPRRWLAGRDLPAGLVRPAPRHRRRARHPADHRSLRAASWRARLVRHRLPAGSRRPRRAAGRPASAAGNRSWRSIANPPAASSSCRRTVPATSSSSPTATRCSAPALRGTTSPA